MPDPTRRLRLQARQFANRRKPTGTRYPGAFREEVVAVARARVAAGLGIARIARDLGLRSKTVALWLRRSSGSKLRAVRVERDPRPVAVLPEVRPVVVTPSGLRIEGLDLDGLLRVIRALA